MLQAEFIGGHLFIIGGLVGVVFIVGYILWRIIQQRANKKREIAREKRVIEDEKRIMLSGLE
ncbi:MAG: hypothetical protein ACFFDI_02260 [Promethearchaeota archaeon]